MIILEDEETTIRAIITSQNKILRNYRRARLILLTVGGGFILSALAWMVYRRANLFSIAAYIPAWINFFQSSMKQISVAWSQYHLAVAGGYAASQTWSERGEKSRCVSAPRLRPILRNAKALASGEEILLSKPEIPESKNYVMFDLEGPPPQFDELHLLGARTSSSAMSEAKTSLSPMVSDEDSNVTKMYLWGMQVFGETPSDYICSTAGLRSPTSLGERGSSPTVREGFDEGDRQGWECFLAAAAEIFDANGDIPFVHWSSYEATMINLYLDRFGDDIGRAARVQNNLLDLLPIVEKSIVLPLPSYSLNEVSTVRGSGWVSSATSTQLVHGSIH